MKSYVVLIPPNVFAAIRQRMADSDIGVRLTDERHPFIDMTEFSELAALDDGHFVLAPDGTDKTQLAKWLP